MPNTDFRVGVGVAFDTSNEELQRQLDIYARNLKVDATVGVDFTKAQADAKQAASEIQRILKQAYQDSTGKSMSDADAKKYTTKYLKEYIKTLNQAEAASRRASASTTKLATEYSRITKANTMRAWADNNTKAAKKYGAQIDELISKLTQLDVAMTKAESENISLQFRQIQGNARAENLLGFSTSDKIKNAMEKFGGWSLVTGAMVQGVQLAGDMYQAVYDIDSAMTSLYKVTDETDAKYNQFLTNACANAQELGRTVSGLVEQTAEWAKLGYSLDDAEKLSQVSSIYANVGEVDDVTSVKDLVTAMKANNKCLVA